MDKFNHRKWFKNQYLEEAQIDEANSMFSQEEIEFLIDTADKAKDLIGGLLPDDPKFYDPEVEIEAMRYILQKALRDLS